MGRRNTTRHASVVGAAHGYPSLASDVLEDDILDYLFFRSDGTSEGNETARLHRER